MGFVVLYMPTSVRLLAVGPKHMSGNTWWFVCRISDSRFEIQRLREDGTAEAAVEFENGQQEVLLLGAPVPRPVLEAAARRALNDGEYANAEGKPTHRSGSHVER